MLKSVLIVDEMHPSIVPLLESEGYKVDYEPQITAGEVLDRVAEYSGLVVRSKLLINKLFLEKCVKLEFIARAGAGMDQIDVKAAESKGIYLLNAPEGNQDALAEHSIAMLLTLFNNLLVGDAQIRSKVWDREGNRGYELKGKTVAIIGFGHMGDAFARRLTSFGCKVIAYDKFKRGFSNMRVEEASMMEVYVEADIVSLNVPLTAETRQMVNAEFFERFQKPIWLLNTSRGEVVVLKDLLSGLKSGKIRGAALDVLENEKLHSFTQEQESTFGELVKMRNVLFSPHVAGWSFESYERINQVLVEKIRKLKLKETKTPSTSL
ncbi:MAG: NAD(P)-dependent oxidoreductase [Imperialibacter sp.]|uniref:NAD(P)-dependent oxidoreductase n=1 Tax=Imperialibacter sp. TaxID=2038411 RepID=UPI0032F01497